MNIFNIFKSWKKTKKHHDTIDDRISRIEESLRYVTSGPWISFVEGRDHDSGSGFIKTVWRDIEIFGASSHDMDFIADARDNIPRLIAEIKRLRKS